MRLMQIPAAAYEVHSHDHCRNGYIHPAGDCRSRHYYNLDCHSDYIHRPDGCYYKSWDAEYRDASDSLPPRPMFRHLPVTLHVGCNSLVRTADDRPNHSQRRDKPVRYADDGAFFRSDCCP